MDSLFFASVDLRSSVKQTPHTKCIERMHLAGNQIEVDAVLCIFLRSEKTRMLKYAKYIGDRDEEIFNLLFKK